MDDGAGISRLWLVLLLLTPAPARCICPSKCTCRDDALIASCDGAGLQVVPIQLNPDLEVIRLSANRISNVHYTLTFYTSLRQLDVSLNKITSLGAKNFESQTKLLALNASHNHITTLGKEAFRGLKNLQNLDLSHNQIENVEEGAFRDTVNLQILDLSYNGITSFLDPTIFKTAPLKVLNLHNNEIIDIPTTLLKHFPNFCVLETLTLSFNLIETIEEKAFQGSCSQSLKTLTLGSNIIRDIDKSSFNPLANLAIIDLSFNNLTFIPTMQLSKLIRLKELDLSGNRFTEVKPVAFQSLFQLRILKLSRMMYLERVDTRAFVDNIRLESVHMDENNGLTRIPPRIFHGNPQLIHVSLKSNSLTTADVSHFPLDRLHTLDLSGNPLNCNCSLHWLWSLAQLEMKVPESDLSSENDTVERRPQLRITIRNLMCESPDRLRGQLLTEVPESEVHCETTWMTVAIITALVLALFGATCVVLLMFGSDWKMCKRRRTKAEADPAVGDTRRLAAGLHAANGPPPILMLMPDKHYREALMTSYMHPEADTKVVEPWMNGEQKPNDLTDVGSPRKPHVVYV